MPRIMIKGGVWRNTEVNELHVHFLEVISKFASFRMKSLKLLL